VGTNPAIGQRIGHFVGEHISGKSMIGDHISEMVSLFLAAASFTKRFSAGTSGTHAVNYHADLPLLPGRPAGYGELVDMFPRSRWS
jgi:hypothetical protein